jgi:hypothetical protein
MESLNGQLWQKLQEIIATYGADICDEPGRLEGLLRDQCGQYKREIRLLINTLKEGVVSELRLGKESMPVEVLVPRLCKKIEENLLLSPDAAEWAVKSWAVALGLSESLRQKAEEELKHVNKARTKDEVAVKVELQAKAASGPGILGRVRSFFGGAKSTPTYVPPPSPPKPSSRGPRSG